MRRFQMYRFHDVSGVSGDDKVVAEGVQFTDGRVAIRWYETETTKPSTVLWDNINDAIAVHGHGGNTRIFWFVDDFREQQ